jgi:hypothetical protein
VAPNTPLRIATGPPSRPSRENFHRVVRAITTCITVLGAADFRFNRALAT